MYTVNNLSLPQLSKTPRPEHASNGIALNSVPLFAGLAAIDLADVSAAGHSKSYTRGELIHMKGDPVQRVFLVISGSVKQTQLGSGGSEVILRLGVPGDVLGATCLICTGLQQTTAQAFRACRVLTWDARVFRVLVNRFPVLHQNMIKLLGEDLSDLEERFREIATEKVALRVARQLLRLCETIGRRVKGEIEVGLSREELAQMTGTTLFTVSRLLSSWEAIGVVKPGREAVTVCDMRLLQSVCE